MHIPTCTYYAFYQHLYNEMQNTKEYSIWNFLNDLAVSSLTKGQPLFCEGNLTEKEIYNSLINFKNKESLGNNGFIKTVLPFSGHQALKG